MKSPNMKLGNHAPAKNCIVRSRLSRYAYVISLLNEGKRVGLLTNEAVIEIQHGFMEVLRELIGRYTQGESHSVAAEIAERIMLSILYATDAYLLSLNEPEQAIQCLKTFGVRKLYDQGLEAVRQCFEQTKEMYREIHGNKMVLEVEAYQMTIEQSLPLFLRHYEMIFDATNTMTSMDYPLAIDDMRLQGVFYVSQYMKRLKLEQSFCARFDPEAISNVLDAFGKTCRFNYRIELFNIFELIMNQSIFSVLSGGEATNIIILPNRYDRLADQLRRLTPSELRFAISSAIEHLQGELGIAPPLQSYMDGCKENFIQRVLHGLESNSLSRVVILQRETIVKPVLLSLNDEETMSDVQLRSYLQEIAQCPGKEQKVNLILKSFKSLRDYLDLLDADCLYGEEYEALYQRFGEIELAILVKVSFCEELRTETSLADIAAAKNDDHQEWQRQLGLYLQSVSKERLCSIDRLLQQVDEEQLACY